MVEFRSITKENVRAVLALKVAPSQEHFVANNAVAIAQASVYPSAWYRGIYADQEPVGFFSVVDHESEEYAAYLWRFMIDANHQRKGYGRAALSQLIDIVRAQGYSALYLSHVREKAGNPGPFYEKLGFSPTGHLDEGEVEMVLRLED